MSKRIKIDIVADVVCPWCAIGYRRLNQAIEELELENKVEIVWQPFELNPDMPIYGKNANQYSIDKYGLNPNDMGPRRANLVARGEEVGFKFDFFEEMKIINTQDIHILLDYAKEFDKQTQLEVRLVEAFFSERKDISDKDILSEELQSVGLNVNEALARLDNFKLRSQIIERERYWLSKGISGVPTMIFNDDITLNGALPMGTYKQVLTEILEQK